MPRTTIRLVQSEVLERSRGRMDGILRRVVAVPAEALPRDWSWRGGELELRHGLYHLLQHLHEAANRAAAEGERSEARGIAGQASEARWDLHALLLRLAGSDLDLVPAEGEWSVRQTLDHVLEAQDWWEWLAGWWAARAAGSEPLPVRPRREDIPARYLGDKPRLAEGPVSDIRARFDGYLDRGLGSIAVLERAGRLGNQVTIWQSRVPVELRYYPYRWVAHIREHTIQVDKTLAMLERAPSEQERIARLLAGAYGRLEGDLLLGDPGPLGTVLDRLDEELRQVEEATGC